MACQRAFFALLTDSGIPSLIVEAGGEGRVRSRNVAAHAGSVLNVLKYLGMIVDRHLL